MISRPLALAPDDVVARLGVRPGFAWLDGDGRGLGARSFVASDPVHRVRLGRDEALDAFDTLALEPGARPVPRYVVALAYDAGFAALRLRPSHPETFRSSIARYDAVVEVDEPAGRCVLHADDERAHAACLARLAAAPAAPPRARLESVHEEPPERHLRRIADALAAIGRGDVYQVNLARFVDATLHGDPRALYAAMRRASPVPFGAYLALDEGALLGRSMERFLAFDAASRRLETRPIKGTVARPDDGAPLDAASLRAHPKEHAEHTMVVDLLRNDLSRVAEVGTVRVEDAFTVEPYARLAHMVSTVACTVRPDVTLGGLLRATYPPGSVTGTPKRAAVARIDATEARGRGAYCGAYGFVAADGSCSLAVAIRTALVQDGALHYGAGGGIVEASDPELELAETRLKTRVLWDAVDALAASTPETW